MERLELVEGDLQTNAIAFRPVDLIYAALILEYVDAEVTLGRMRDFLNPDCALREALRVLRSGGRFGLTVWAGPDKAAGLGIVMRAVEKHGSTDAKLPPRNLAKIRAAVEGETRNHSRANGTIELPMPALLASARKS